MEFRLPEIGEGVYEAELTNWLVEPKETVRRGQDLLEVMTDKATMTVPSPFIGVVEELLAKPGDTLAVGDVVLTYGEETPAESGPVKQSATAPSRVLQKKQEPAPASSATNGSPEPRRTLAVKAAPSVRQMARKLDVDLTTVRGSGPDGRILLDDLTRILEERTSLPTREGPLTRVDRPLRVDFGKPGTRMKMIGLRRKIAEHMTRAKQIVPHYSYVDECNVTELVKMRQSLRKTFDEAGVKLTYLAFFVKGVVAALKEVPIVNASLDEEANEIVLHDRYNIGIAVSTPGGLIVPVLKDADKMDLATIAGEIERLSSDARKGQSHREDLSDGTFTVTSVGNIGGLFSTPVINHPEVGILGIGKIVRRPIYVTQGGVEQIRPADLVHLSLSFDHRVVDGAVGAHFTNALIEQLTNPARLVMGSLSK